jgi:hypothetical protein
MKFRNASKASLFFVFTFINVLFGCASIMDKNKNTERQELSKSSSIPGAEGQIEAKEGKNGNTELSIAVDHLAPPTALKQQANTYVVWAKDKATGRVTNLGALQVDQDRRARMDASTPLRKFDLYITPEDEATVMRPSGDRLLWASLDMD